MPERAVPPDLADFAGFLVEEFSQSMTGQFGELVQALREPAPMRTSPSDRWAPLVVGVPTRADRVLGEQYDRARVTLHNVGPETIALGNDESVTTTLSNRFDLVTGASLTISTRAPIFAVSPTGTGVLAIIVEEWNL